MSVIALVLFVVLIALLVWLAQQLAHPWSFVCYALAILFVIIAILQVLGIGSLTLGPAHAFVATGLMVP